MTYAEAIQFLYSLQIFGAKLGLENTFKLSELCGNPHEHLRFIHVAGTNGKGSTCAMLESIYRASGLRVGLFTSPHLVSFRERIQVDRELISEADVARLVGNIQPKLAKVPSGTPTFFEVLTVVALQYFTEQRCDLVIWETGMGGRLDATNIVTPLASVITNVGLDHQAWLGETIEKIAAEKAGIIKPGVPVITGAEHPVALRIIRQAAAQNCSDVRMFTAVDARLVPALPLPGEHQRLNAALAVGTVQELQARLPVCAQVIESGLATVSWPGRFQLITRGQQTLVLDGAHNAEGSVALSSALQMHFPGKPMTLALGILSDKDWSVICNTLAPLARRILLTPVKSARTTSPQQLLETCHSANPAAEVVVCTSVSEVLDRAKDDPFLVITGSLYLIGEALEILGLSPANTNERDLNEYTPVAKT